ncbi:MAG: nuclear transport factor 2 family protein [Ignavibacteriaceae bacterium]|nr:nuclear transport factor 2 family protein [Ignavibacteriaceae bacterium]
MRSMLSLIIVGIILSAANLFAQSDYSSELKMNINKITDTYSKAMLSGDYNTIAGFFADDAIYLPAYNPTLHGKDAILESNKKDVESGMKYSTFKINSTDAFGSGDLVYEIGTFEVNFTVPNNTTAMNDHGKYLNIWQRQGNGSWKLKVETWNSDVNPMSMNQAGAKSKEDESK